ncbi:hypothetical protein CONCODRAFT_8312 [Conidiobolus coronatus NRRL 28638]|uniref:Uncharacterized protein n=1 Tax=Conidiobolus coronatus (strain ATCC 28846 / CBS 209.66 / NRRL 28638) TaxID=796925 RepID=A0A137P2P2_CONC2|nr:hypothetical protein CONCODRAFT_8312 [Conidiobolus coronatus NRRL 28638]|eukprot:KXN69296.1 hypothetical protein CONCODRAFT_8312 [Conidiobolus coronatus NRRL 28638]
MLLKLICLTQLAALSFFVNAQDTCGASKYSETLKGSKYDSVNKLFNKDSVAVFKLEDHKGENISVRDVDDFMILNFDEGRLNLIYDKSKYWEFVEASCG